MMENVVDHGAPLDLYWQDSAQSIELGQTLNDSLDQAAAVHSGSTSAPESDESAQHDQSTLRRRRRKNGMLIRERRSSARGDEADESDAGSDGSGISSSSDVRRQQHPSRITIDSDLHSLNLRSPLSPLEPPYHSLRHKPSNSTTIGEPDTPLASLVPPANFAEQFKYIICSSGLLEARSKADQRRSSLLAARSRHAAETGHRNSFVSSSFGHGTDLEQDTSRSRPTISQYLQQQHSPPSHHQRPARYSSASSRISVPTLPTGTNPQTFTRYPITRPCMTSYNSGGSTTYLTASCSSSRTNTPTMILNPLPIIDFDDAPMSATPTTATMSHTLPEVPQPTEGLRQRRRQRSVPKHSHSSESARSTSPSPRRHGSSWSYLFLPLFKFGLRSTLTLAGYLWMWAWMQVGLIYGIGSWMWDLGWRIVWGSFSRRNGNKTSSAEREADPHTDREKEVERAQTTRAGMVTPAPLVLRTEPSETRLAIKPDAVTTETRAVQPEEIPVQADVAEPSLQASALEVLTRLVSDNEAFEQTTSEAFEKLEQVDLDDGHDPLEEALRAKLSAALESVSSSMISASSALMPLVSEQDLSGLHDLYKIDDLSDGLLSPGWDRNRFSSSSRDSRGLDSSVEHSRRVPVPEPITTPIDFDPLGFPHSTPLSETGVGGEIGFPFDRYDQRPATVGFRKPSAQLGHMTQRPGLYSLRSSQSVSNLRRISTSLTEDRFTPLPVRSPRPSSVMGQSTWSARNKKRTQSLIGGFDGLGRSNSVMSDRDYRARRNLAGSETGQASRGRDSPYLDVSIANASRPPSRLSSGRRSPLTDVSLPNHSDTPRTEIQRSNAPNRSSQLKPLMLPVQAQREKTLKATEAPTTIESPVEFENATRLSAGAGPDPRTHQRKRSSLQSIGFRRPSSTTQTRPSDSPRPVKRQFPLVANEDQGMHDFIQGLPTDLVASLSRANSRNNLKEAPRRYSGPIDNGHGLAVPGPRSERYPYNESRSSRGDAHQGLEDPLTLLSLKSKHRAIHAIRRQTACRLLALQFQALQRAGQDPVYVARYWADVHGVLTDMRTALIEGTSEIRKAIQPIGERATQPWFSQTHTQFAPQKTDARVLQDELDDLSKLVEVASRRIADVRNMAGSGGGNHAVLLGQWNLLRSDLGRMIGDWERGRILVQRMTGTADDFGNARSAAMTSPTSAYNDYPMLDRETNTSTEMSLPSIPSMDEIDPDLTSAHKGLDDASMHLLNSTSPAFLPPPGIESVFEDFVSRLPPPRSLAPDGRKLTREERILAVKMAREETRAKQAENSTFGSGGGMDLTSRDTKARTGEVVMELKDVMDRIRKQRQAEAT